MRYKATTNCSQWETMMQDGSKMERRTFSVPEAGQLLGLSRNSAYEAARRGDLPTIRIGRRLFVAKAALDRMLAGEAA
jgi:excisionase family DNA binding protein